MKRTGHSKALPILDRLEVVEPCSQSWAGMAGDHERRHCEACNRTVHDLSQLTTDQAAELLSRPGRAPCVRFQRDRRGRVITRRSGIVRAFAAASALVTSWLISSGCSLQGSVRPANATTGEPESLSEEHRTLGVIDFNRYKRDVPDKTAPQVEPIGDEQPADQGSPLDVAKEE